METLDESDEVPADEDMLQEERTIPDITIPDIDLSAFDSSSDDASSNPDVSGDLDEVDDHSRTMFLIWMMMKKPLNFRYPMKPPSQYLSSFHCQ